MSIANGLHVWYEPVPVNEAPHLQYLSTIQGYPVFWDDQSQDYWWPDGWPEAVTYNADEGITIDAMCDLNRVPPWVRQPKPLDCGHVIVGGEVYVTWLGEEVDECLACAASRPRAGR